MTTPGATEAVTPEQLARAELQVAQVSERALAAEIGQIVHALFYEGVPEAEAFALIRSAIRHAEANALRRAAELAKEWSDSWRKTGEAVPRESENNGVGWYRSTISTAEARARVLDAFIDHIRSLLPKEAGK